MVLKFSSELDDNSSHFNSFNDIITETAPARLFVCDFPLVLCHISYSISYLVMINASMWRNPIEVDMFVFGRLHLADNFVD